MEFLQIREGRNDITYDPPKISFPAYEYYKEQALEVADYIREMTVTPDTVKDAKKTLADARKVSDRLNRARIDIKKEILKGYENVESQIKEIAAIIDDADRELRACVRELDEQEREKKRSDIAAMWSARVSTYDDVTETLPDAFDLWMRPMFLNKSTTMKFIEADMAAFLETKRGEIRTLSTLGVDYLVEYAVNSGNMTDAIDAVNKRKEVSKRIAEDTEEAVDDMAEFVVTGKKDIEFAEMLLSANDINYVRKDLLKWN